MARWCITITVLLSNLLSYLMLTDGHDWGDDFAGYILQAQSIVAGSTRDFIDANRFTMENSSEPMMAPLAYPWGYPLLLSAIYRALGLNLLAMKCLNVVCFGLSLLCVAGLFARRLGRAPLCLLIAVLAFSPAFLGFDSILSDIPSMFLSLWALYLIDQFVVLRRRFLNRLVSYLLLGVVIFLATSVRSSGILLLPVLGLCQIVELGKAKRGTNRSWHAPILCTVGLTALVPYGVVAGMLVLMNRFLPHDGSSYFAMLSQVSVRGLAWHTIFYLGLPRALFSVVGHPKVLYLLSVPFGLFGLSVKPRCDYFLIAFCALNFLVCVVWPAQNGLRLIFPLLPCYLYFVFLGLAAVDARIPYPGRLLRTIVIYAAPVMLALVLLSQSLLIARENIARLRKTTGPFDPVSAEMFDFINRKSAKDAVIVFFKPRAMRLFTGRNSFATDRAQDLIMGDFMVVNKEVGSYLQPPMPPMPQPTHREDTCERLFENSNFVVFRIPKTKPGTNPSGPIDSFGPEQFLRTSVSLPRD